MFQILTEGFSLGISTGFYCLGACMPFFLPYLLTQEDARFKANLKIIVEFLFGRMIAYILFAALISFLGITFKGYIPPKFLAAVLILVSLLMIVYAFVHSMPRLDFCKWVIARSKFFRMPFLLGFLIGLNPCPPFLVGMVRLLMLGSVIKSVILFFAFFLGTSIYTFPLIFVGGFSRIERMRAIGIMMAFIAGFWFLILGITHFVK